MRRKVFIGTTGIALALTILLAGSFVLVPHSVRLYLASTATCEHLESALRAQDDSRFSGAKAWEAPLALLYRLKYWHLGGPTKVDDRVAGESSVFTILLTAADRTGGQCDTDILMLLNRYIDGARHLDDYDATGYTALQQAVVFQKPEFVQALLEGGADRSLAVRSDNELSGGKNAIELATWFAERQGTPQAERIVELLVGSD